MSDRNTRVLDQAAEIAEAANYWILIKDSALHLISRDRDSSEIVATFFSPALISLSVAVPYPIKKIISEWTVARPYTSTNKLSKESRRALVEPTGYGNDVEVRALSTVEGEVRNFLLKYYDIEKRPKSTAEIAGVLDLEIGDRVDCFDMQNNTRSVITISGIKYDFDAETTTISGHSTVTHQYS